MSSTQPGPASMSDQSVEVALTVLSLPTVSTAHRMPYRPSSPPPPASLQDDSSPSSLDSWVDLPSITDSGHDSRPAHQDHASRRRRRMNRGIRSGLSNLPTPPSPFGTQLQPSHPVTPRSTPYHHVHRHNTRFTAHPTPRALEVENDRIPRPDPEEVYDTFLSAVESFKRLAVQWGGIAANVITHGGKKDLTGQVMKIGLGVVCVVRPGWVLGVMNASWRVLRDPWRSYHHAVYSFFIASVLLS